MFENLINYIDKFGPEILVIQFGFLVILSTLFLWLWFSNRRKYHNLKHAIPANVVKNYLDSIIQNSTALKSSLFRGGGQDFGALPTGGSVPSVMPLQHLAGGEGLAISGTPSSAMLEELNQMKAQVASLEAQLSSSQNAKRELEDRLSQSARSLKDAEKKIRELEALLAKMKESGGPVSDEAMKSELEMVTRERDELRDKLKEFEIIADDLANLKRLQQENDQLKRSLGAKGLESFPAAPTPEPAAEVATSSSSADVSELLEGMGSSSDSGDGGGRALEDFLGAPADEPTAEESSEGAPLAAASESGDAVVSEDEGKASAEKTPEDLLSEFEKMLG